MARRDVTLRGLPPTNVPATVSALAISRSTLVPVPVVGTGIRISAVSVGRSATVPAAGVITPSRDDLVAGVTQPDATNTGTYPGIALEVVNGNVTLTTPGQTYKNKEVRGFVRILAANVTVENCWIRGAASTPGDGTALVDCTDDSVVNAVIKDCELVPQFPHWNWDSGIKGHHYTALRNNIHHVTDGLNVFRTTQGTIYDSNVVIQQNWVHDLAYWTAATGGIVHPSMTSTGLHTHNDCIQLQGGFGTEIIGNRLDAYHAHQYAHWFTVSGSETEPYNFIALQSLPAGNPGYAGPFQPVGNRGTGTNATGRYNTTSLSAIQFGTETGRTCETVVHDNWLRGGNHCVNGAITRNTGAGDTNFGSFLRNRFDHGQGNSGTTSGGDSTQTINIGTGGWAGNVTSGAGTADKNYYEDNLVEINFRGD